MIRTTLFVVLLLLLMGSACQEASKPALKEADPYQLVWADEFEQDGLPDATKWSYDVGDGCPDICGWGNNELQYYTEKRSENARVEDGHLIVEAHKEEMGSRQYSSARLVSKNKGDWLYGKIEIRAKLPSGIGTWPAIWMLPTDWEYGGWPNSGEIDIMEHVGYSPDSVFGTVHTGAYNHVKGTQKGGGLIVDGENGFHTYGIEWTESEMLFLTDGQEYYRFENEKSDSQAWPFDKAFHLILNVAVGGNWGGSRGVDENIWPQRMVVDYVRVYQQNANQ